MSFLDVRDGSLIAGDAFTTQTGVLAAGTFKLLFPFQPSSRGTGKSRGKRSETPGFQARCASLWDTGKTIDSPLAAMDQAVELAFRQCRRNATPT